MRTLLDIIAVTFEAIWVSIFVAGMVLICVGFAA